MPENNFSDFHARLSSVLKEKGGIPKVARLSGIGEQTIRKWGKGTIPGVDKVAEVCEAAGASADYLLLGRPEPPKDFVFTPRYRSRLSASHGEVSESDRTGDTIAFHQDWLKRFGPPEKFALFDVVGDSMAPHIKHGSTLGRARPCPPHYFPEKHHQGHFFI